MAGAWSGQRTDAPPFDATTRVEPPLRAPSDALALLVGLQDGTVDAIATDHSPRRTIDTEVAFGEALPGISGLETALSLVLGAVEAGWLSLGRAVRALTTGPWRVIGGATGPLPQPALREDQVADLVVVDRADTWSVLPEVLRSKGRNTPLLGRALPGRVLLTVAAGRLAYIDPSLD
jgi:dihydroorotase